MFLLGVWMVIFFIGCFKGINTGRGGHYYSLLTMAKSIGVQYQILVVGDFFPPAYQGVDNVTFVKIKRFCSFDFSPKKYQQAGCVSVVHAYDNSSAIFASKFSAYYNAPLVVTKPGGAPLRNYSVTFDHMVVFHGHDRDFLSKRKFFKPKNLALIPNRVFRQAITTNDRPSPFPSESQTAIKIIRVARIGSDNANSIIQSYHLFNRLEGVLGEGEVYLSIVGYIEDMQVYERLKHKVKPSPYVGFYTSPDYYKNASELLVHADVVVGSGRSFMEGMLYDKFVFFP